jgi:DNA replication and repair protein RecF
MDFAASQIEPDYLHALQAYNRALRSRNYVFKREAEINWRQADAYARLMAGFHRVLVTQRQQLMQAIEPRAQEVLGSLSGGSETMHVRYDASCAPGQLFELLLANREEEQRTRTTFAGAHRDDFTVLINKQPADTFASEGQQRSLSLALKLAQTRVLEQARGEPPLLLIDDVFGELDPHRRRALLELLPADSQRIITTTHLEWAGALSENISVWQVEAATVIPTA